LKSGRGARAGLLSSSVEVGFLLGEEDEEEGGLLWVVEAARGLSSSEESEEGLKGLDLEDEGLELGFLGEREGLGSSGSTFMATEAC
jgi:hypothetical protein